MQSNSVSFRRHSQFLTQLCILIAMLAYVISVSASPVLSPESAAEWFHDLLHPQPGTDIKSEIQCYGLPFGALGSISHLLTFYTSMAAGMGRKPLNPRKTLRYTGWDTFINILALIFTTVTAGFTISSCRNSWPFTILAVWKLMLGLCQSASVITGTWAPKESAAGAYVGFLIFGLGAPFGLVGIFQIAHQTFGHDGSVRIITYVLIGLVAFPMAWSIWEACVVDSKSGVFGYLAAGLGLCIVLMMFYTDWILAAIAHNWVGAPDSEHKYFYWTYLKEGRPYPSRQSLLGIGTQRATQCDSHNKGAIGRVRVKGRLIATL